MKIVRARHVAVRSDDVRSAAKDAPPPTVRMIQRHLDESPAPEGLLYDSGLADLPPPGESPSAAVGYVSEGIYAFEVER